MLALCYQDFFRAGPLRVAPLRESQFMLAHVAVVVLLYIVLTLLFGVFLKLTGLYTLLHLQRGGTGIETPEQITGFATLQALDGLVRLFVSGLVVLATPYLMIRRSQMHVAGLASFGLAPIRIPSGIALGLWSSFLLVPWLLLSEIIVGQISGHLRHGHPPIHPLLEAMGKHPPLPAKILLVVTAVVVAPIAEEIIFRGLLQTTLLSWGRKVNPFREPVLPMVTVSAAATAAQTAESAATGATLTPLILASASQPVIETDCPPPSATRRWVVILVASALFAAVHFNGDNYEAPPIIFVLAIALGYIYERSGNLWASITLHAAFNGVSTMLFLAGQA